ncbi:unnamed protein product [Cuscuta campestris]|uniref:Uncharacterized protein n=1 Tax=Cuscuta campestris TaxID=132261 RepID=A0A484KSH4_9ASTE|nr:unnamed protein product [Cuscuta campestris]
MMRRQQDQHTRALYELSALALSILRCPPAPIGFADASPVGERLRPVQQQISPAGFATFLLGISCALMVCGSVTFFIGFVMMPWVLCLAMVLYFVGIVASLSMLGRSILCHLSFSPEKHPHSRKLM